MRLKSKILAVVGQLFREKSVFELKGLTRGGIVECDDFVKGCYVT